MEYGRLNILFDFDGNGQCKSCKAVPALSDTQSNDIHVQGLFMMFVVETVIGIMLLQRLWSIN